MLIHWFSFRELLGGNVLWCSQFSIMNWVCGCRCCWCKYFRCILYLLCFPCFECHVLVWSLTAHVNNLTLILVTLIFFAFQFINLWLFLVIFGFSSDCILCNHQCQCKLPILFQQECPPFVLERETLFPLPIWYGVWVLSNFRRTYFDWKFPLKLGCYQKDR